MFEWRKWEMCVAWLLAMCVSVWTEWGNNQGCIHTVPSLTPADSASRHGHKATRIATLSSPAGIFALEVLFVHLLYFFIHYIFFSSLPSLIEQQKPNTQKLNSLPIHLWGNTITGDTVHRQVPVHLLTHPLLGLRFVPLPEPWSPCLAQCGIGGVIGAGVKPLWLRKAARVNGAIMVYHCDGSSGSLVVWWFWDFTAVLGSVVRDRGANGTRLICSVQGFGAGIERKWWIYWGLGFYQQWWIRWCWP